MKTIRFRAALLALAFVLTASLTPAVAQDGAIAPGRPEPRNAAVRDRERQALIEFYNAMGGPGWIQRDSWGSDRPVGKWHGVTTDADGYVVLLTIYDNYVTGPLSTAICRLERLQTLHLSFNYITGALPDELGRLPRAEKPLAQGEQADRPPARLDRGAAAARIPRHPRQRAVRAAAGEMGHAQSQVLLGQRQPYLGPAPRRVAAPAAAGKAAAA